MRTNRKAILLAIGVAALTFVQVRQTAFVQLEGKGVALADSLNYTFEVLLGQEAFPSLQRVAENSATIPHICCPPHLDPRWRSTSRVSAATRG